MATIPSDKKLLLKRIHTFAIGATLGSFVLISLVSLIVFSHEIRSSSTKIASTSESPTIAKTEQKPSAPFPVGVDPLNKTISENVLVSDFFSEYVAVNEPGWGFHVRIPWFDHALGKLAMMDWFQNLASLSSRLLVIQSGERKEEIASHFASILGWNTAQKKTFIDTVSSTTPAVEEGKFYPGTYTVARDAEPKDVAPLVLQQFDIQILSRYTNDVQAVVPLQTGLTIASLLEREAYDFEDMRWVSGVIWNRLFAGMKLQIDATLQYARANKPSETTWWPQPRPVDKYIKSAFNTYQNEGLPPAPIANPSIDSVLAALNPHKTDCMYYFHDAHGEFHCSKTYEEHVALLKQYYGRGK